MQINSQDPLPPIETVFALLKGEESHRNIMSVRVMHPLIDLPLPTTIQQIPVWIQGMVAVKVISAQVQNMVMADSPVLIVTSFILPIVGDTY